ncbi:uncharacterized protein F5891DRAFT_984574 [Suillus fuscotomentosus]|uniref:Uncharacterized protein n=1 Tax=Suillus fuscotomentosus TaxID=1912939 RepID=A0AAD4HET8_9AGAM|nr:uncharacterized protein F5891DRAFT_984574 [Suillus fuscotomentosus]KAG1894990.1 hypothetical protein F5891DRAFT_984574 [Suillus fuscotomentosus]
MLGEGCIACTNRCSNVVKEVEDPESPDVSDPESQSSDSESQSSDSSDDIIVLDKQPSGWVDKLLDQKARASLEAELKDLERHLAEMEDMHRRADKACMELEHELNHLKGCLVD